MKTSRRNLPPMGALQCLEAAVRLESFSRAADDVGLTQSAVSRQISTLEDWLQVSLFERVGRRIRVTPAGRDYMDAISPALAKIRYATAAVLDRKSDRELTIATLPSFGMRWLAPRLPRFSAQHPDIVVNFTARSAPFDLATTTYDGAIHFGQPDWPSATHVLLFRETSVPVLSPALARDLGIRHPNDLLSIPLLSQQSRRAAWTRWFARAGVGSVQIAPGPTYEHFLMLAQAAAAGAGAALIPTFLVEPELENGTLVTPFSIELTDDAAYYFVRGEGTPSAPLAAFEQWISAEGGNASY